jgi:hypothetical protein
MMIKRALDPPMYFFVEIIVKKVKKKIEKKTKLAIRWSKTRGECWSR